MQILLFSVFYHIGNSIKKTIYRYAPFSAFRPSPINIYVCPSHACNSQCAICYAWKDTSPTVSIKKWKKAIDALHQMYGPYLKINVSGGEVLYSKFLFDIADYCVRKFPFTGVITNGFLLNKRNAYRLMQQHFSNINISIDGTDKRTIKGIRGIPFSLKQYERNLSFLTDEKLKRNAQTKIIVKTVISGLNMRQLIPLTKWVKKMNCDGIYFQPIQPIFFSDQSPSELKRTKFWISKTQQSAFRHIVHTLVSMKKAGYPILNEESNLLMLMDYFNPSKQFYTKKHTCEIEQNSLFLFADGNVSYCPRLGTIGNIDTAPLGQIVHSQAATKQIRAIHMCHKQCLETCMVKKSFLQKIKLYVLLNS